MNDYLPKTLRQLTHIQWGAIAIVAGLLLALILQKPRWAADGNIAVPVRVLVFDAASATPVANARVTLVQAPPWTTADFLDQFAGAAGEGFLTETREIQHVTTTASGIAEIPYNFHTGASHTNPVPRAHTDWSWVIVVADGYGGVTVPLRHHDVPVRQLRTDQELRVPIGLIRTPQN